MERKIGEIFEFGGEWYQCVESDSCGECSLFTTECGSGTKSDLADKVFGQCSRVRRSDNKHAIFKKLEKVGEPYIEHDHSMNKDVVVQDYKLYNQHACYNGHEKILCFGLFDKDGIVTIKSKEPIKSLNCKNSIAIEIKQNEEDMEEKKLNLKPFDIQKAREGKPVCTRDGRKARIICFDRRLFYKNVSYPILALVECSDGEDDVCAYNEKGKVLIEDGEEYKDDLMMLPEKKEGWANVYKERCYESKKEAIRHIAPGTHYIGTIKVEWEE